jgi:hypothetical protein
MIVSGRFVRPLLPYPTDSIELAEVLPPSSPVPDYGGQDGVASRRGVGTPQSLEGSRFASR